MSYDGGRNEDRERTSRARPRDPPDPPDEPAARVVRAAGPRLLDRAEQLALDRLRRDIDETPDNGEVYIIRVFRPNASTDAIREMCSLVTDTEMSRPSISFAIFDLGVTSGSVLDKLSAVAAMLRRSTRVKAFHCSIENSDYDRRDTFDLLGRRHDSRGGLSRVFTAIAENGATAIERVCIGMDNRGDFYLSHTDQLAVCDLLVANIPSLTVLRVAFTSRERVLRYRLGDVQSAVYQFSMAEQHAVGFLIQCILQNNHIERVAYLPAHMPYHLEHVRDHMLNDIMRFHLLDNWARNGVARMNARTARAAAPL